MFFLLSACRHEGSAVVSVRIIPDASKGITSSISANTPEFNPSMYDIYYYAVSHGTQSSYGASSGGIYRRIDPSTPSILLSQGYWEIFVKGVPKTTGSADSLTGESLSAVPHFNGTSGRIYINEGTDEILIHVDVPEDALGSLTIRYTFSSNETGSSPNLTYTIVRLGDLDWEPTAYSNATGDKSFTDGIFYREIPSLPAGLYMMMVSVLDGETVRFTETVGFSVRGGRTTAVTGTCSVSSETTHWVPQPDPEKPVPSTIVHVDPNTQSGESTVQNFTSAMEPGKIYQVESYLSMEHADSSADRIILDDSTGKDFAIDLNGKELTVSNNGNNNANSAENTTIVTIKEGQSLSLFNYAQNNQDSCMFGSKWSGYRYQANIAINGGSLFCGPNDLNNSVVKIYGPRSSDSARDSIGNHLKQGAVNIEGKGGYVYLGKKSIITEAVKGISTIGHTGTNPKNSLNGIGTTLASTSSVTVAMEKGASIDVFGDGSNDTNVNGIDAASGIYLTCGTASGQKTHSEINITLDASSINAHNTNASTAFTATGVYVSDTSGNVWISLTKGSSIAAQGGGDNSNQNKCTNAAIALERVSGNVRIDIDGGSYLKSTGMDWVNHRPMTECITNAGIYMDGVQGSIEINLTNGAEIADLGKDAAITTASASLDRSGKCIILRNCSGPIKINISADSLTRYGGYPLVLENCTGPVTITGLNTTPIQSAGRLLYTK